MTSYDAERLVAAALHRYTEHLSAALAVTSGDHHTLVYANAAFRRLSATDRGPLLGRPIVTALPVRDTTGLTALLDRAFRTGVGFGDRTIGLVDEGAPLLSCAIWPDVNSKGESEHLVVELRVAAQAELTISLQREVAERLLLSALREHDAADVAEGSRRGASFLATEGRRVAESLDESATLEAIAGMSLPYLGAWCIVDTLGSDDTMRRLAIIHPDPAKQALLDRLEGRWIPGPDDGFGLPAALRNAEPIIIAAEVDAALGTTAHDPDVVRVLLELGIGSLLTVPLTVRKRLVGAVTFVSERTGRTFTPEDIELAKDLASGSAMALDHARLHGEAISLKAGAEAASQAKSAFLGMMGHELRTPLNAIGGYVDLIDMEIYGPVTLEQHAALARIRRSQQYLTSRISDVLDFTKIGGGHLDYDVADVIARDVLEASVALVEPMFAQEQLIYDGITCDAGIVARGDREKVIQILVNLLSNAVKFTSPGGHVAMDCAMAADTVLLCVSDTGIGIPPDKLEVIFDPFVQVDRRSLGPKSGIGLGLAISRGFARGMDGDLTVESTLGQGARFTLTLPRSLSVRSLEGSE